MSWQCKVGVGLAARLLLGKMKMNKDGTASRQHISDVVEEVAIFTNAGPTVMLMLFLMGIILRCLAGMLSGQLLLALPSCRRHRDFQMLPFLWPRR